VSATLLGFGVALSYFKVSFYLRGFTTWGPLLRAIQQIIADVMPFIAVVLITLIGFAMGLALLLYGNGRDFGDPASAFASAFNYGLYSEFNDWFAVFSVEAGDAACLSDGGVGEIIEGRCEKLNAPAAVLFQIMMLMVQVLMCNMLIAIMTDSYDKVRENAGLESAYEQGKLLLEIEASWLPLLSLFRRSASARAAAEARLWPQWLHVLRPADDDDPGDGRGDGVDSQEKKWSGRLHAMRKELRAAVADEMEVRRTAETAAMVQLQTESRDGRMMLDAVRDGVRRLERRLADVTHVVASLHPEGPAGAAAAAAAAAVGARRPARRRSSIAVTHGEHAHSFMSRRRPSVEHRGAPDVPGRGRRASFEQKPATRRRPSLEPFLINPPGAREPSFVRARRNQSATTTTTERSSGGAAPLSPSSEHVPSPECSGSSAGGGPAGGYLAEGSAP